MAPTKRSYYEILQVSISAEQEVIDAAYKRLAQKYHPDKNSSANATRKMQEINEAYSVLRDPVRRAEYDRNTNFNKTPNPSDEEIQEIKRRAAEAEQKRKDAERFRQRAEQEKESYRKHAEDERLRRERAEQEKESFRKYAENERLRREKVEQEKESFRKYEEDERFRKENAEQELRQVRPERNTYSLFPDSWNISSLFILFIFGSLTLLILALSGLGSLIRNTRMVTSIPTLTSLPKPTFTITNHVTSSLQTIPTISPSETIPTFSELPVNSEIGNTWTRSADEMVMIFIPSGEFQMGSTEFDTEANLDEKPQNNVYLDAFWIDQTEITNSMFESFVEMTGYQTTAEAVGSGWVYFPLTKRWQETPGADWQHPLGPSSNLYGRDNYPVVQVSWYDALAYCTWAGGRLPTEAEWEKAARGTDGRIYPWGNQPADCSLANFWDFNNGCVGDITEVGSYAAGVSPYGLMDMAGNVLEWVQDWYSETYYSTIPYSNPAGPPSGQYRVLRGGAWDNAVGNPRTAMRNRLNPDNRDIDFGFRCARSP